MQLLLCATRPTPHGVFCSVLGARDVCLVGENPTCSVPAYWRYARVYGLTTAVMLEMSTT